MAQKKVHKEPSIAESLLRIAEALEGLDDKLGRLTFVPSYYNPRSHAPGRRPDLMLRNMVSGD